LVRKATRCSLGSRQALAEREPSERGNSVPGAEFQFDTARDLDLPR
jgi:hypothetical protein